MWILKDKTNETNKTEAGSQIQGANWWLPERRGMEVCTK